MHKAIALAVAVAAICAITLDAEQGPRRIRARGTPTVVVGGGGGGTPAVGHPRLMMTASGASPTVTELKARYANPGGAQATDFQSMLDLFCKDGANGGILDNLPANITDTEVLPIFAWFIATYQVTGANYNQCANLAGLEVPFLATFDRLVASAACSIGCPQFSSIAHAYDWASGSLSGARRTAAITWLQTGVDNDLSAGPIHHRRGVASLQYHLAGYVYDGDDPASNADATTRIALRSTNVTASTGTRAMQTLISGTVGGETSGLGYFLTELDWHGMGLLDYADSYRTFTGSTADVDAGANTVIEYYPQWLLHQLYPFRMTNANGAGYMWGKTSQTMDSIVDPTTNLYATTYIAPFLKNVARIYASSNANMAALAQWLVETLFYTSGKIPYAFSDHTYRFALWGNFFGYNTVTAQSPTTLGLAKALWFNPYGSIYIRDAWTFNGTASMVKFQAPPYNWINSGYGPITPGTFTVNRGGPIIIEPGAGVHSVIQEHGWGGNTIIFPKPAETRGVIFYWDKGSARPVGNFSTADETTDFAVNSQWDIGGLKTTGCAGGASGGPCGRVDLSDGTSAHTYSYAFADLSRAYNGSQNIDSENSSKIDNFERHFLRFPPPTIGVDPGFTVIYDRVTTTGTGVEPRWLLYPASHTTATTKTMSISGATTTCDPSTGSCTTRNSVESWDWLGTCGTMYGTISYASVNGLSAKGYWRPLLPASCKIIERGGPNGSGQVGQTDSHEFEDPYGVQGGNHLNDTGSGAILSHDSDVAMEMFTGIWRYELLYQTTATSEPFLNVIEDVETSAVAPTTLATLSGTNTTGVRIDASDARCAIFKSTAGTLSTGDFQLQTTGTFQCFVGDLGASTSRTFAWGSNITSIKNLATGTTDSSSPFAITSNASQAVWIEIVVSGAGSGATNTISW